MLINVQACALLRYNQFNYKDVRRKHKIQQKAAKET
uniref:Uncharacterized protein n=1 Tax=Rhizophora mucronata TaxID=61149 RepID=A0A2P2QBH3_RHIMU